jgi:hypothetical protein
MERLSFPKSNYPIKIDFNKIEVPKKLGSPSPSLKENVTRTALKHLDCTLGEIAEGLKFMR